MLERGVENTFTFVILPGDSLFRVLPNIRLRLTGVLFRAITLQQGKRRRRRSEEEEPVEDDVVDMVMQGINKYSKLNKD